MIPYFVWNAVYCAAAYLIQNHTSFGFEICPQEYFSWKQYLLVPFQLADGFRYNVAAWFVMALFLTEVLNVLLRYILNHVKAFDKETTVFLLYLMLAVICIGVSSTHNDNGWVISITRCGYLGFYYEFGYFYKQCLEEKHRKIPLFPEIAVNILLNIIILSFCGNIVPYCWNMSSFLPEYTIVYIIKALLGILFWVRIAGLIAQISTKQNPFLLYFSNHTFSLMMHQGIIGLAWNFLLMKLTNHIEWENSIRYNIWSNVLYGTSKLWIPILTAAAILILVFLYEKSRDFLITKLKRVNEST